MFLGMGRLPLLAGAVAGVLAALPAPAAETATVPEPPGLWSGPMAGDTPATLEGAQVIDVPELENLMADDPVLIDVGPMDRKPEGLSPSAIWKPTHRTIPGAHWFPGAGRADLPEGRIEALMQRVEALTQGDRAAPVVTFCRPKCWASWNIGKRLVQAGYTSVYWLPSGVSGWQERNDTAVAKPEAGWAPEPADRSASK